MTMTIDDTTSWHVRYLISQALEGVARELRAEAKGTRNVSLKVGLQFASNAVDRHASKMRGVLSYEADREKVETEDRAESTLADLPVYGAK